MLQERALSVEFLLISLIVVATPGTGVVFAFLPQFVSLDQPDGFLYGVFAAMVREQIVTRHRVLAWMRRVFAGSLGSVHGVDPRGITLTPKRGGGLDVELRN